MKGGQFGILGGLFVCSFLLLHVQARDDGALDEVVVYIVENQNVSGSRIF